MKIIDITQPHSSELAPWPDDTPFNYRLTAAISQGSSCNVGAVTTSIHSGTHLDAPFHFDDFGKSVDALPADRFVGPARVFAAHGRDTISREVFDGLDAHETPRVLVATGSCDDKSYFPQRIPTLAPDVPAWLGAQGVTLIGFDLPSVDQLDSLTLPIHHALDDAGILILENLDLRKVAPGDYELIALPLRIVGADGSPVRAVLVEVD